MGAAAMMVETGEAPQRASCETCPVRSRKLLDAAGRADWLVKHRRTCKGLRAWTCRYCGKQGRAWSEVKGMAITLLRGHFRRCKRLPFEKWRRFHGHHYAEACPDTGRRCPPYQTLGEPQSAPESAAEGQGPA